MATIGVLTYTLPAGLKLKNTSFNKATFGTVDGSSAGNNTIVTKIPDLGMIGNEVMVMRKKSKLIPLLDSNAKNIQQEPAAKKLKLSDSNSNVAKSVGPVAGCKKSTPLPQAVARRNARERNRVKQVNNGFAALRQHIPDEIAEAFEAAGNGRGSAKKLSKVETLRMAVEYIRSLERLLELDNLSDSEMTISSPTKTVIKSETSYTPTLEDEFNDSTTDTDEKIAYITDILPDITTVHGQQYIRIPGTNTYQLITNEMFENEENIQPLTVTSYPDGGLQTGLAFTLTTTAQEVSPTIAPAPISIDRFGGGSGQSLLSPADHLQQHQLLSQLQMQQHVRIKSQDIASLFPNQLAPSSPPISEGPGLTEVQLYETPTHQFKREIKEEIILEQATLSEESMMEAIDWWGANTPQSDDSVIL